MTSRAAVLPLPTPRLLDEETAAAYLGRSKTTFRTQWQRGILPQPHRDGGRLYWDRVLLDRYVDALSGIGAQADSWANL